VIVSGGYALPDNTQIKVETPAPAGKDVADKSEKPGKSGDAAKPAAKDKE